MPQKTLIQIANLSPGIATAAAQSGITPAEQAQIAAFAQLKETHQYLSSLGQNDAYKSFNALTPEYQDALKVFFDPKYTEQDKGFFGNILKSVQSSAHYAAQSFKELGMQIAGLPVQTTSSVPAALLKFGTSPITATAQETGITTGAGKILKALVRPAEKLVKQPYQAQGLYEQGTDNNLIQDWQNFGRLLGQGASELMPGGKDAKITDNSTTWKKYWEQASDKENVFDPTQVQKLKTKLKPDVAYVGQMLAGKKSFIDNYEQILSNPDVLSLIQRYTSGKPEDADARKEVADAVARFEKAKISPGRDVARALISVFPFEAEKAMMGDGASKAFFNTVSGGIDFAATFGLDPLIVAAKLKGATDVARFGLIKMGENPLKLDKAFQNASVRRYWDNIGQEFQAYEAGDLATKGAVLTRISNRFPEISTDVAMYMAPNIKNADTALEFFRGSDIVADISKGNGAVRRNPLIPRYTVARGFQDSIRDAASKVLLTDKYSAINLPNSINDIARMGEENPVGWAEKIGFNEAPDASLLAGRKAGSKFVSKDASTAAKIDRVVRQLSIAPKTERIISISDASGSEQVYRLMRTVLDKNSASTLRVAWIGASEGERLLMYKGMLKTLAYGMGFDHSVAGRKFIEEIDAKTTELYSVNQSALDLGEFSRILGTTSAGSIPAPTGVRKLVQDATDKATAEGKANRLAASTGAELRDVMEQVNGLKAIKKQMIERSKIATSQEEIATIQDVVSDIDRSLKILGGTIGKTIKAKKEIKGLIDNLDPIDVEYYNAAEGPGGSQYAVRAYQLSQARYVPNLMDLRKYELRGNIFSTITGRVGESVINQNVTDVWSYLNLYPRLGIRTTVEEVGTYGLINGTEGMANYFKGFAMAQEIRKASAPSLKKSAVRNIEKEVSPLGILSRTIYKITRKNYSKEEIIAMADDPEKFAKAVSTSLLKDKFNPGFINTASGKRAASYAEDWIRNGGQETINEISGAVYKAEFKADAAADTANYLNQYGPSVTFNTSLTEALKDQKFASVYSQIDYNRPGFLVNWFLDLQNTIGRKNIFGQIVFSNIYKKEEDVIDVLAKYLDGKGSELAKRSALWQAEGSYAFAKRIYADSTNALRDYSGRLNTKLIEEIKASDGIVNFDFRQLAKYTDNFQQPKSVLGRELIPLESGDAGGFFNRVMKNGYGWIGKQIAILDREPITYGNYLMYRDDLRVYESNMKQSLLNSGIGEESAALIAKNQAHEVAESFARKRTLSYVDNSDVRTNLAFNLRNFGRYYRATEDFWRRAQRIGKYEKQAIVRLAIINQTFEHSGFIHKDSTGSMYFTYPGDDLLNWMMGNTLFRALGLPGAQPMSVNFGGKVKMLTPSLDPQSNAFTLSGPFIGLSLTVLENLPGIGSFLKKAEPIITGGIPDQEWWRKITPINVQRLIDLGVKNDMKNGTSYMTEQKFSASVQAARLLISLGQGPQNASELDSFGNSILIQAQNIMAIRLVTGLGAPASVQMFATKDVPKEMINAGSFTWDSEFAKLISKFAGDPNAFSKALVVFAKLFPTKTVYAVSKTSSETQASFQKTFEAAQFVKNNKSLIEQHKEAASFFIPINGTNDIASYTYLKSQGFIKNKQLEDYLREASVAGARQEYNQRRDYYDAAIQATNSIQERRILKEQWSQEQDFFKKTTPMLAQALENNPGYKALKVEALDDLRFVVQSGNAPDKKLAELFNAMIIQYDNMNSKLNANKGSATAAEQRRKAIKQDTDELIRITAGNNPNAVSLYWNIFNPLIGA